MRLRWELSKVWQKRLDDPVFDTITSAQWLTYAYLMSQDKREESEQWRDRIEYMARFIDSKAVDQIQGVRERMKSSDGDSFEALLQSKFGRGKGLFGKIERARSKQIPVRELGQQIQQVDEIRMVKKGK
jgi:hypothetical protein